MSEVSAPANVMINLSDKVLTMAKRKKDKIVDGDLTVEKVKQFKGFENISDEEASNIAYSLKEFSILAYHYYQKTNKLKQ